MLKASALNIQFSNQNFSKCGCYRWSLERNFGLNQRNLLFIGLNPSTGNNLRDDATLRRLICFSKAWNYGNLLIVNLFARVSRSPSLLYHCADPVGPRNNLEIKTRLNIWANNANWDLWLGWGAKGIFKKRNEEILCLIEQFSDLRLDNFKNSNGPLVAGLTKQGHPLHPLYLSRKKILMPFKTL